MPNFTVAQAALAASLPEPAFRSWQHRSLVNIGQRAESGRYAFTESDVFVVAIMRDLARCGVSPNIAAEWARFIVARAGAPPGPFDAIADPAGGSPMLVPTGSQPEALSRVRIVLPLPSIWADILARLPA